MTATETTPTACWRADLDDYVQVLEVHPDGRQAVAGSLAGEAVLVDTADGTVTRLPRHELGVLSAAWSPDGECLAVGGQDGLVRIRDRHGVERAVVDGSGWVTGLAWSADARLLAIGAGRRLLVVDRDGAFAGDFDGQTSTVTGVAWSADGSRVGASAYGGVAWYDMVGSRAGRRRRFDWKGSLLCLAVSPDGRWACAGAQDATVQLWRLWSGGDLAMSGYPAKIERLGFRSDSRWLAVACMDELTVWDFAGRGPGGTAPAVASGHDQHIEDLAWTPSGSAVATGGADGRVIVWATPGRAGQKLSPITALESDAGVGRLRWLGDDDLLVGRADGGIVRLSLGTRSGQAAV
ncbi:MAG: WD40 repeat domain-containing protein [Acidimicrobiales bacterium]